MFWTSLKTVAAAGAAVAVLALAGPLAMTTARAGDEVAAPKAKPAGVAAAAPLRVPAGFKAARDAQAETYTHTGWAQAIVNEATGLEFVYVPAGEFMMGSPTTEKGHANDEIQHRVTLTQGFYLGKFEVTQGQWQKTMDDNPSEFQEAGLSAPIEKISWEDCQTFIGKLNAQQPVGDAQRPGGEFRLPTEAEWEYACRAGTTSALNDDQDLTALQQCPNLDELGWYAGNSERTTHPVGKKKPNAWGLHDMHGNVLEWCADSFGAYPAEPVADPTGATAGQGRVLRGGCWDSSAKICRSACRGRIEPEVRYAGLGCRLVFVLTPEKR